MTPRLCQWIVFGLHLLLQYTLAEFNEWIAPLGLSLRLDALFVLFTGLYLGVVPGLLITVAMGLLIGAQLPLFHGEYLISLILSWLSVVWMRRMIKRDQPRHIMLLALSLQTALFIGLTLRFHAGLWREAAYLQRLASDCAFSAVVLFFAAAPWCEFQRKLMLSLGWNLNLEAKSLAGR